MTLGFVWAILRCAQGGRKEFVTVTVTVTVIVIIAVSQAHVSVIAQLCFIEVRDHIK
jgi:hypothetical protein